MAGHVFISYSRRDSAYVQHLVQHLKAVSIDVWFDESLTPGTPAWVRTIEKAIEDCAAVIPVMTIASTESVWVDREVDLAQELRKPIFPLLVEGRRFMRLRDIQAEQVTDGQMPSAAFTTKLSALTAAGSSTGVSAQGSLPQPPILGEDAEILQALREIIAEITSVEPAQVQLHSNFLAGLKIDSLTMVEVVVYAEDRFKIQIPDGDVERLRTVSDAIAYIKAAKRRRRR